jgi:hypothetical protein
MDETLDLADEQAKPGIRKGYRPLTDADILGTPFKKKEP